MSLCIQAHPELTTDPAVCRKWIKEWVTAIEADLDRATARSVPAVVSAP
jgi:hypothetical protein